MKDNIFIYLVFNDPKWIELIDLFCKRSNLTPSFIGSIPQLHQKFKAVYPNAFLYNCCKWLDGLSITDLQKTPDQAITIEELNFLNQYSNTIQNNFLRYDSFNEITYDKYFIFYYNLMVFWKRLLIYFKPKCIFFSTTPHHFDELILYYLAQFYTIKTIVLESFQVNNTYYTCIKNDYSKNILFQNHISVASLIKTTHLKNNVESFIKNTRDSKSYQKPFFEISKMKIKKSIRHKIRDSELYQFFFLNYLHRYLAIKNGMLYFHKPPSKIKHFKHKINVYIQSILNKMHYKELASKKLDFEQPYIYVALHLLPEETASPMGALFTDQFLMINLLSKSIPAGWKLYVKEHPSTFGKLSHVTFANRPLSIISHKKHFYHDIDKLKNTHLVPIDTDSYTLIDHAKAVATLTGTVGIESVLRNTPVLAFGYAWYRSCPGVFGIEKTADIKQALKKIMNGYTPPIEDVCNYLHQIEKEYPKGAHGFSNSPTFNFDSYFPNLSAETIIKNLSKSITKNILHE